MLRAAVLGSVAGALAALALAPAAVGLPASDSSPPRPPHLLPGDAQAASVPQAKASWLVGADQSPGADALARRFGARRLMRAAPVYEVPRRRASAFVGALRARGLYAFSEPNQLVHRYSFPADPATGSQWALSAIGLTSLTPPPPGQNETLIGVIEHGYDRSHPEFAGANIRSIAAPSSDSHGTMVTSVAAAPANGRGIVGAWPGADVLVSGSGDRSCGNVARAIDRAANAGATVINMSYGFYPHGCYAHFAATEYAFGEGIVLVAAAGNEGSVGRYSRVQPAGDPHVVTVAALGPGDSSPPFSNANASIDVAAPGVGVLAAVPLAEDDDGARDGYGAVDGTSFSAPLVAASAAWVGAVRPHLHVTQLTDLLRVAVRDLGPHGWDPHFGFGAFDLPTALRMRAPRRDLREPNEDVEWVDGRREWQFPIWEGRGRRSLTATLDKQEDPVDVYPFVIGRKSSIDVTVKPLWGDPDVEAFEGWAKTVYRNRGLITSSRRRGRRLDGFILKNPARRGLKGWLAIYPKSSGRSLNAGYRLSLRRVRYRR